MSTAADLLPDIERIRDQGAIGSCTANAGANALGVIYHRAGQPTDFSALYLYYHERSAENRLNQEGAFPQDIGRTLIDCGICKTSTWPYVESNQNVPPSLAAETEATVYKIKGYDAPGTPTDLDWLKAQISRGSPPMLGFNVNQDFIDKAGKCTNWHNTNWNPFCDNFNKWIGGHEVCAIGWNDDAQRVLCVNSWSGTWGDGGFFGMPYAYFSQFGIVQSLYAITTAAVPLVPIVPPVPYVTQPATVIEWFHIVWRFDIQTGDFNNPAVQYWANHPGGFRAFLDCEQTNHNDLINKLRATLP